MDTTIVSSYFYTVNNYGQRTGVNKDGTAFASTRTIAWGYNSKGEVVKADHSADTNFSRAYAYDGIGNRTSGGGLNPPSQTSYTANALNQYTAIGSLTPVHDDDGNMTSGPLPANVNANSTLVWDGENRLIEAQVTSGNTVNYVYDSQSRRIAETVGTNTTVYIYDGWNPIAVYTIHSSQFTLHSSFTWGIDLSGSMQGAGGVGGLLMVTVGSTGSVDRYFPTYDGNGNVSEYLDSTGTTVAHYEYDPFGKTTVATGSKVADFSHRFSTKPLDVTTGLYYYGYRFYDPETGRWPSRDPIEERGGVNLYGFVGNDGVGRVDVLGLCDCGKLQIQLTTTGWGIGAPEYSNHILGIDAKGLFGYHAGPWTDLSEGFAHTLDADYHYNVRVKDGSCPFFHISINASAQEEHTWQFDNPGAERPDFAHEDHDVAGVNEIVRDGEAVKFNHTERWYRNPLATSRYLDYEVNDVPHLEKGILKRVRKQVYVRITVSGKETNSKGDITDGNCCKKTYWIKAERDENTDVVLMNNIVPYENRIPWSPKGPKQKFKF